MDCAKESAVYQRELWTEQEEKSEKMAGAVCRKKCEYKGQTQSMNHPYKDILYLPNPTSKKHPRMSMYDRAAQFSPFAALTGYDELLVETARLTSERIEIDETIGC